MQDEGKGGEGGFAPGEDEGQGWEGGAEVGDAVGKGRLGVCPKAAAAAAVRFAGLHRDTATVTREKKREREGGRRRERDTTALTTMAAIGVRSHCG